MRQAIKQLVLASNNPGKVAELSDLLASLDIEVIPQSAFDVVDIEETGTTFVENAILKAKYTSKVTGLPALADDSGLVVPCLNGAPGIYSARYAGEPKSDRRNNDKLLRELAGKENRKAAFVCVMVLCLSDTHPLPIITEGIWQGEISEIAHGDGGFGYDPLFYVPTHKMTAAEMDKAEKNRISHRAKATQSLLTQLTMLM
ncbi:MAG: non-canonical purine NTP pyrophosphatase [Gammaproteobacteria bacterium]|nr:MAG: non-canonical purine NTP pyrophosphatase [Gammaproteobacteria bacterium]